MDTIKLISDSGRTFEIPSKYSKFIEIIKETVDENDNDNEICISGYSDNSIGLVISYIEYYIKNPMNPIYKPIMDLDIYKLVNDKWYADFISTIDRKQLFELTNLADFLVVGPLLNLCLAKIATQLKGQKLEVYKEYFGISD